MKDLELLKPSDAEFQNVYRVMMGYNHPASATRNASPIDTNLISITEANRIFADYVASCPVVYATMGRSAEETIWSSEQTEDEKFKDTHRARLICIEELKPKDTAESLLREFLECCKVDDPKVRWGELRARVSKLLDGGSGR